MIKKPAKQQSKGQQLFTILQSRYIRNRTTCIAMGKTTLSLSFLPTISYNTTKMHSNFIIMMGNLRHKPLYSFIIPQSRLWFTISNTTTTPRTIFCLPLRAMQQTRQLEREAKMFKSEQSMSICKSHCQQNQSTQPLIHREQQIQVKPKTSLVKPLSWMDQELKIRLNVLMTRQKASKEVFQVGSIGGVVVVGKIGQRGQVKLFMTIIPSLSAQYLQCFFIFQNMSATFLQVSIQKSCHFQNKESTLLWQFRTNRISSRTPATRNPSIPARELWCCMCQKAAKANTQMAAMKKHTFCTLRLSPQSYIITCPNTYRNQRTAQAYTAPTSTWMIALSPVSWNSQQLSTARQPMRMQERMRLNPLVV